MSVAVVMLVLWGALDVPLWVGAAVLAAWTAKDLALFPLVRRAYEHPGDHTPAAKLAGRTGVVEQWTGDRGWIRVGSELWQAAGARHAPFEPGARVRVTAVRGLTLVVEPEDA